MRILLKQPGTDVYIGPAADPKQRIVLTAPLDGKVVGFLEKSNNPPGWFALKPDDKKPLYNNTDYGPIFDRQKSACQALYDYWIRLPGEPVLRVPRLLPVGVDGDWHEKLSTDIVNVLLEARARKYLDTGGFPLAVRILVLVQEALDAQGPGIQGGRKELWMDNAYAILQTIRKKRKLLDRSLPDIDHMFEMIERPPTQGNKE